MPEKKPEHESARTRPDLDDESVLGDRLAGLDAEVAQLREAVADLAAQNLDLHNQLNKVVSVCERIFAGADPEELGLKRRSGVRRAVGRLGRAVRAAAGRTVGAARLVVGGRGDEAESPPEVEIRVADPVQGPAPRIAIVVGTREDSEEIALAEILRDQTDSELKVAVWNEPEGSARLRVGGAEPETIPAPDRRSLAAALDCEFIGELALPAPVLHPTVVERCRWTLASEALPLVVSGAGGGPAGSDLMLRTAEDWIEGRDPASERGGLAKAVGGGDWMPSGPSDGPSLAGGLGRSYFTGSGGRGRLIHRVAPLEEVVAPRAAGSRRSLVVVTAEGGDAPAAWLIRTLAGAYDLSVVVTRGGDASPLVRGLTEVTDRVYAVGRFLEPSVWGSLARDLARAHQAGMVIRVGARLELPRGGLEIPIVDLPLEPAQVDDRADLVLSLGSGIAAAARKTGLDVVELTPGPLPPGGVPAVDGLAGVRAAYGVPDEARLVLTVCDLEPELRPEDVAAVARRLDGRDDVRFLLIGRGSLAGSVSDLAAYLGLRNFTMAPLGHRLPELVAVSDCVLSTAEVDPWPKAVGAALALNRWVVAAETDGVRELAAAADSGRCELCPPGDVDAMAEAVFRALEPKSRRAVTKKAWREAERRGEAAAEALCSAVGRVLAEA